MSGEDLTIKSLVKDRDDEKKDLTGSKVKPHFREEFGADGFNGLKEKANSAKDKARGAPEDNVARTQWGYSFALYRDSVYMHSGYHFPKQLGNAAKLRSNYETIKHYVHAYPNAKAATSAE
jgi:hypothetical protein